MNDQEGLDRQRGQLSNQVRDKGFDAQIERAFNAGWEAHKAEARRGLFPPTDDNRRALFGIWRRGL